jgi:putative ABC transport system permease protein
MWGTAAVIFLVSWGGGMRVMLERGFAKTGKNMGQAFAGRIGEDYTPAVDRRHLWFSYEDVGVLRKRARIAELVGAERQTWMAASYGQRSLNFDTRGVEPFGIAIRGPGVSAGRQVNQGDVDHRRRVVVLGHDARQKLLGARGGVGSRVRVGGRSFEVVGILNQLGQQFGGDGDDIDDQLWLPITTHHVLWPDPSTTDLRVDTILYRIPNRDLVDETQAEVRAILAERLRVGATDDEAIATWSPLTMLRNIPLDEQRGLMFVLAATTLIVGGIGILNMMLDSVRERRREIGLRLAVGARRRDIVVQFFAETFTVVVLGGALGVGLGVGGCLLLGALDFPDIVPVPVLSARVVGLAVGTMGGVGLVAGVVPAWRAAQTDPALTLRAE